jgi:multimeric flavodoxin WrbA
MNILLINGSPRKDGNTKQALQLMGTVFKKEGLNPIHIQLGGMNVCGCKSCGAC